MRAYLPEYVVSQESMDGSAWELFENRSARFKPVKQEMSRSEDDDDEEESQEVEVCGALTILFFMPRLYANAP
jgi:hypothetical protein